MQGKIILIGAGNIGSRHMQSLGKYQKILNIDVVDPDETSLNIARERFHEIKGNEKHVIRFMTNLDNLQDMYDVAILATNSKVRYALIEELSKRNTNIKYYILEKVLFQTEEEYYAAQKIFEKQRAKAWVNCALRSYEGYQWLKERLADVNEFTVNVTGAAWGLGCNAIHYLDVICYLAGGDGTLQLNGDYLDPEVTEAKRVGYMEFTGIITGSKGKCRFFSIHASKEGDVPLLICIDAGHVQYCIFNEAQKVIVYEKGEKGWTFMEKDFEIPWQSDRTSIGIESLLTTGTCRLPTYDESAEIHVQMIRIFIAHLRKNGKEDVKLCPIT